MDTHGPTGDTYDGEWVDGKRHGVGVAVLSGAGRGRDVRGRVGTRREAAARAGWKTDPGRRGRTRAVGADGKRHGVGRRAAPPPPRRHQSGARPRAGRDARFVDYEGEYVDDFSDRDPERVRTRGFNAAAAAGRRRAGAGAGRGGRGPTRWGSALDPMAVVQGERVASAWLRAYSSFPVMGMTTV